MKYSLRSLMIVVTLGCIALGGRIEYLRRMAAFHRQEVERLTLKMKKDESTAEGGREEDYWMMIRSIALHDDYEAAICRPWTVIREPPKHSSILHH